MLNHLSSLGRCGLISVPFTANKSLLVWSMSYLTSNMIRAFVKTAENQPNLSESSWAPSPWGSCYLKCSAAVTNHCLSEATALSHMMPQHGNLDVVSLLAASDMGHVPSLMWSSAAGEWIVKFWVHKPDVKKWFKCVLTHTWVLSRAGTIS